MLIKYADASTRARILDALHHSMVGSLNLELDQNLKPGTAEVIDRNGRTSIIFKAVTPPPLTEEQQHVGSAEACTNDEDHLDLPRGIQ